MDSRCDVCNAELSACGEMTDDGPSDDCRECQLGSEIATLRAELDSEASEHARTREQRDDHALREEEANERAELEEAKAALAALDAAVSERHLPCEDGIVGGCEVCRALRAAKGED